MSVTKIILKDGFFYREVTAEERLGSQEAIFHQFAMRNSLAKMGEIFTLENPFHEIFPESQAGYPVSVMDSNSERIYDVVTTEFPMLGFWAPMITDDNTTLQMSLVVNPLEDNYKELEVLEKPVLFKIPDNWGRLHHIFHFEKEGNFLRFQEVYMMWELEDDKITRRYHRTALPNTYDDARICMGRGLAKRSEGYETDGDYLFYLFRWLYNTTWNQDLGYNTDWLSLDADMEPIPFDKHPWLIANGHNHFPNEGDPEIRAKLGLFHLFENMPGGIVREEANVMRFLI